VQAVPTRAMGLTTFSIEGRRAPGLFVVGWLAAVLGGGVLLWFGATGVLGSAGGGAAVLSVGALVALCSGLLLLCGSQTVERRAAGSAYAGPSPVLVFATVVAIAQLAGIAVGLPLETVGEAIPRPVGDLLAVLLQAVVFLGVVRLTVVVTGALSWRAMGISRFSRTALLEALGGAVFAGPVILVTSILAVLAVQVAGVTPLSPLPPTGTFGGLVLHLLAGAVVAPVAEEVLFRGFALTAWTRTVGPRAAIVRSSILFVLAHVLFVGGDTFGQAAGLAFVGGVVRVPIAFVLGWLFVRTGSIWGPIGLHAAFNGILIVLGELAAAA
jgi:membrane protease YdiL (CAAX protease family)